MPILRKGDPVCHKRHPKTVGKVVACPTLPFKTRYGKKWIQFLVVEVVTPSGVVRKTWKRRECRLAA